MGIRGVAVAPGLGGSCSVPWGPRDHAWSPRKPGPEQPGGSLCVFLRFLGGLPDPV